MGLMEDLIQQSMQSRNLTPEEQGSSFFQDAVRNNILMNLPQTQLMNARGEIPDESIRRASAGFSADLARGQAADQYMRQMELQRQQEQIAILQRIRDPDVQAAVAEKLGIVAPGTASSIQAKKIQQTLQVEQAKQDMMQQREAAAFERGIPLKMMELGRKTDEAQQRQDYYNEMLALRQEGQQNAIYKQMESLAGLSEKLKFSNPAISQIVNQLVSQLLLNVLAKSGGTLQLKEKK